MKDISGTTALVTSRGLARGARVAVLARERKQAQLVVDEIGEIAGAARCRWAPWIAWPRAWTPRRSRSRWPGCCRDRPP
jgi:hypothetical protein